LSQYRPNIAALLLVVVCATPPSQALNVGDTPSIRIQTLDDRTLTTASLAGKLVVVHFWSIGSRPCFKHAPVLVEQYGRYHKRGVYFLSICADRIDAARVENVSRALEFTWFQAIDAADRKDRLALQWRVPSIPETFIISPKGEIVWRGHPVLLGKALASALVKYPPRPVAMIDHELAVDALIKADEHASRGEFLEAFKQIESINTAIKPDRTMKQLAVKITAQLRPDTADKARSLSQAREVYPEVIARLKTISTSQQSPDQHHDQGNANNSNIVNSPKNERIILSRLRLAERYAKAGNDVKAYDVYRWIAVRASRTDVGKEAGKKAAAYEADPAFMARYRYETQRRQADALLELADKFAQLKQVDQARATYQRLIKDYPITIAAAKAKIRLEKLK